MADQPARTDSGSPERVAFDLWYQLRTRIGPTTTDIEVVERSLALYAECLNATKGFHVDVKRIKT